MIYQTLQAAETSLGNEAPPGIGVRLCSLFRHVLLFRSLHVGKPNGVILSVPAGVCGLAQMDLVWPKQRARSDSDTTGVLDHRVLRPLDTHFQLERSGVDKPPGKPSELLTSGL